MTTPPTRILYVCSAARCGSTLTDMFLGGHPQVASTGELSLIGKALALDQACSCGQPLRLCPSWQAVFQRLGRADWPAQPYALRLWDQMAWNQVDARRQTARHRLAVRLRRAWLSALAQLPAVWADRLPLPAVLEQALANKLALYDAIAGAWGRTLVIDSSKSVREAVALARRWPERVRVLLVTRDGRGTYLSRRSSGRSRAESVAGWRHYYRRALPLLESRLAPGQWMRMRYEDLAADPAGQGAALCRFAGIPFDPAMLDLGATVRHMVNGNRTRFAAGQGIQLDERWRQELAGAELAYFQSHGAAMNRHLGYEDTAR